MTENELMQYKALVARVSRNRKKIEELKLKDIPVVDGKVKGSSKIFPYIETHFHVQMYEPIEVEKCSKLINKLEKCIREDNDGIKKIEDFISEILDPDLQTIFEMRVYERMKWIDIAIEMDEDRDRTTYSKKFRNYIENSHVSPISQ